MQQQDFQCRVTVFYLMLLTTLSYGCNRLTDQANTVKPPLSTDLESTELQLAQASKQSSFGNHDVALQIVEQVLIADPDSIQAATLSASLLAKLNRYSLAAQQVRDLAEQDPSNAIRHLRFAFDWHLRCRDFHAAEKDLRRGIELAPNNPLLHRQLAGVLNAQGRRFEASEPTRQLIRLRAISPVETLSLIDQRSAYETMAFSEFADSDKDDLFLLGWTRRLYDHGTDPDEAIQQVRRICEAYPDSAAAAAFLGRLLIETGNESAYADFLQSDLPADIEAHPEYWDALGNWLARGGRDDEAIRAFSESLRRDPTNRNSLRLMITSIQRVGRTDLSKKLRDRLVVLDKIFRLAQHATAPESDWISQQLQGLTRPWESMAWAKLAAIKRQQLPQAIAKLGQLHAAISDWEGNASVEKVQLARLTETLGFDADQFPIPNINSVRSSLPNPKQITTDRDFTEGLQFHDVATDVGIATTFSSGYFDHDEGTFLIHQANGGGIAAIDYDLDGSQDIYFVQSGGAPNRNDSTPNQLFRQVNERFRDISSESKSDDRGFGQGVCAGDLNQDGFPDLLVGNIGKNRILLNQGDGTFRDASDSLTDNADRWTSSLALGDLDGDHLPEIVEVNYLDDPNAFNVKCEGELLNCTPQRFRAAVDCIHYNQGDGTYTPWELARNLDQMPNYGFGVVIANFDRKHGNDCFVSNDGDLNHFWLSTSNENTKSTSKFAMIESASVSGCSIGSRGMSQACMGIAFGDFDRNSMLDLHVTNFHNESNNLYLQLSAGFFADESLKYQLFKLSHSYLGFGTQSADFDNDGWPDIAILNGHIYDATKSKVPFRMHSQLLRGSKDGFAVQDAGEYWTKKQLARTLALIDFNRDGKMDLVANHLDQPIAILKNESQSGHWVDVELVGVASERDAIGAEVIVRTGDQDWFAWQVGGDGYMCTNEPVVHVGLGSVNTIDEIEIRWPSGRQQTFANVKANCRYLMIEGIDGVLPR